MGRGMLHRNCLPATTTEVCPQSHQLLAPVIEEIMAEIARRAKAGASDPEAILDAVRDAYTTAQVRKLLLELFDGLGPNRQWEIMARLFNDDSMRTVLRERYERAALEADPSRWIDAIIHGARRNRRFHAGNFPKGARVVLYLYRFGTLRDHPNDADLLGIEPDRVIELESTGDSLRVWSDTYADWCDDHYPWHTHQRIQLGSGPQGYGKMLEQTLCHRRNVQYLGVAAGHTGIGTIHVNGWPNGEKKRVDYIYLGLGRVTINGREIFFDPPQAA